MMVVIQQAPQIDAILVISDVCNLIAWMARDRSSASIWSWLDCTQKLQDFSQIPELVNSTTFSIACYRLKVEANIIIHKASHAINY